VYKIKNKDESLFLKNDMLEKKITRSLWHGVLLLFFLILFFNNKEFEVGNLFELIFYVVIMILEKHTSIILIFNLIKIGFKFGICNKKLKIKEIKLKNI
jgi:hypothetical protein